jgi:hypothetical protein
VGRGREARCLAISVRDRVVRCPVERAAVGRVHALAGWNLIGALVWHRAFASAPSARLSRLKSSKSHRAEKPVSREPGSLSATQEVVASSTPPAVGSALGRG